MVELLIVVGIIAIVAAIAIPSMISSKQAAYENTTIQKLAAIGQQETTYKTVLGKGRYAEMEELRDATINGQPLLGPDESFITGWCILEDDAPTSTTFTIYARPFYQNPGYDTIDYAYCISEDQVVRRCARWGPYSKTACTPISQ
jgi:type II secretory pathway pseudopilin PulG